ncbi:hypothetical protein GC105_10270 [Alkalibaculum sp. M08DMB]|uniref:Uncharacterized protein n=1 Tax=Alkalibaculum sporogenes TaxID=2655001 RepID=A0A6A7K9R8_9FIRM|nr:hypothetical protein [Alkalibaculum sporogenes]MPW26174.1 hypothetical protein [Alkalibaculum sporogenes]
MKKFAVFIILVITIFILTACKDDLSLNNNGMPFHDFKDDDIKGVKLFVVPPEVEVSLSKEQKTQLVDILNNIVIDKKVSFKEDKYVGQLVHIQIVKSDDSVLIIKAFGSYLFIDDVWYDAQYEHCEELNQFSNEIINDI